jgi:hypothetical protein
MNKTLFIKDMVAILYFFAMIAGLLAMGGLFLLTGSLVFWATDDNFAQALLGALVWCILGMLLYAGEWFYDRWFIEEEK